MVQHALISLTLAVAQQSKVQYHFAMPMPINTHFDTLSILTPSRSAGHHTSAYTRVYFIVFSDLFIMAAQRKSISERLQLKALQETNPKDFEAKGHCILFFPVEVRYSLVDTRSLGLSGDEEPELMSVVRVKDGQRKHKATLMFIENDLDEELEKLKTLSSLRDETDEDLDISDEESDFPNDTWKKAVEGKLDKILVILEEIKLNRQKPAREVLKFHEKCDLTPPMKKIKVKQPNPDEATVSDSPSQSSASVIYYNDTNLLALSSGGDLKKYSLKVLSVLFSDMEMACGMIGPIDRAKTKGKAILDEQRVDLLKKAIKEKYGEVVYDKKWQTIRKSCNQKCLDVKKKLMKLDIDTENN